MACGKDVRFFGVEGRVDGYYWVFVLGFWGGSGCGSFDGTYEVVVGKFVAGRGSILGGDGESFWVGEVREFVGDFFRYRIIGVLVLGIVFFLYRLCWGVGIVMYCIFCILEVVMF